MKITTRIKNKVDKNIPEKKVQDPTQAKLSSNSNSLTLLPGWSAVVRSRLTATSASRDNQSVFRAQAYWSSIKSATVEKALRNCHGNLTGEIPEVVDIALASTEPRFSDHFLLLPSGGEGRAVHPLPALRGPGSPGPRPRTPRRERDRLPPGGAAATAAAADAAAAAVAAKAAAATRGTAAAPAPAPAPSPATAPAPATATDAAAPARLLPPPPATAAAPSAFPAHAAHRGRGERAALAPLLYGGVAASAAAARRALPLLLLRAAAASPRVRAHPAPSPAGAALLP
ncbi:hypothetical protein AAY473_016658 [Plecturocebus cupreus]